MTRETIDFGIDLGTTNSSIAVLNGTNADIIKNSLNNDVTSSAIYITQKGHLFVGQKAKGRILYEPENAYGEFKRKMGSSEMINFKDAGRVMSPQELSAEVIKSLKNDVKMRLNEDIHAAVITVPADFELPQTNATKEAAQLAGLEISPQIQEPIAAALAYGFQSPNNKVFWFVYDFGGGTFDATIIQLRDGEFTVVGHGGDNFLGGKDIDWDIVEKLFVPKISNDLPLDNFSRGNQNYRGHFAKLKGEAEKAKIQLSSLESCLVYIDGLFPDREYDFEFNLSRNEICDLAEPYITRTIKISQKVLQETQISPFDVEKLILVGGPTLSPYIREMLEDPDEGLGIPLEFSVDPLTVVAQGAAIFAGTQQLPYKSAQPMVEDELKLKLEYQSVGSDPEPLVGGKLFASNQMDFSGYMIEFSSPRWASGRVPVDQAGTFRTMLSAEKGKRNVFTIQVFNDEGNTIPVTPNELNYTIGNVITSQPLTHSLNVALANNEVLRFLDKGTSLPARHIDKLRTTVFLKKGASGKFLVIPVVEGENIRANRNRLIGKLQVEGESVRRDIPVNSEIEVEVSVDESRIIRTKAYLPLLDEEFEAVINLGNIISDKSEMTKDLEHQKNRLDELMNEAETIEDPKILIQLNDSKSSKELQRVEQLLKNTENDVETSNEAQKRLLEFKISIDKIEGEVKWPSLLNQANEEMELLNKVVDEFGNDRARQAQASLEVETRRAIENHDPEILEQKINALNSLRFAILWAHPEFWIGGLEYMKDNKSKMTNQSKAEELLNEGYQYLGEQDYDRVRITVHQLSELLPEGQKQEHDYGLGSTVIN